MDQHGNLQPLTVVVRDFTRRHRSLYPSLESTPQQPLPPVSFRNHDLLFHDSQPVAEYREDAFYKHPTQSAQPEKIEPQNGDLVTRSGGAYAKFENNAFRRYNSPPQ
ncbi:uncharacterized protein LOC117173585 [Belonocnema kinseyi]|uniref:uncharacterized protein LOC117173585 n=1 Tax=Belonocnema kinseyi TaxID=2817044 RepID=UPI00143D8994|nr:uncharacterized protein LOC117173585 [Belonocnema kinseyi]